MFYPFQVVHAINKTWLEVGVLYNAHLSWVHGSNHQLAFRVPGPRQCHPPGDSLAAASVSLTQLQSMWHRMLIDVSLLYQGNSIPRNPL